MEKNAVAHAQQVNTFLTVILSVVYRFNREVIKERFNRVMKRYAMVTPVCCGFGVIPFINVILHDGIGHRLWSVRAKKTQQTAHEPRASSRARSQGSLGIRFH